MIIKTKFGFLYYNKLFFTGLLIIVILLALVYLLSIRYGLNVKLFLADPANFTNSPFYLGIISNVGIVLWAITGSILLFTSVIVGDNKNLRQEKKFLIVASILTFILMTDDLLLFHENVFPKYLGIPQKFLFIFYFIFVLFYLIRFRILHFKSKLFYLLTGMIFFGLSIFFDTMVRENQLTIVLEDGSKLAGIFIWLIYHADIRKTMISENFRLTNR